MSMLVFARDVLIGVGPWLCVLWVFLLQFSCRHSQRLPWSLYFISPMRPQEVSLCCFRAMVSGFLFLIGVSLRSCRSCCASGVAFGRFKVRILACVIFRCCLFCAHS